MERILENKVCVVTGAARGMGKEIALKYARNGANVAVIDINKEGVEKTVEEIKSLGVDSIGIAVDVSRVDQINEAVKTIEEKFGAVHVLANCVGISTSRLMLDVEESEWEKVMNINLRSAFIFSKLIAKNMIRNKVKNGKIVNISSQASKIGEYGNGVYCISKAAMNMMVQVLGLELAQYGICVNAVCPGYVNTEMMKEVFAKRGPIEGMTPDEYKKSLTDLVPLKRLAEPEEIADFMLFLSSDKADYITGVSLTIAGGRTLI